MNSKLKKLAALVAREDLISKETEKFILSLNRGNLKTFLMYYKLELLKNSAKVTTASALSSNEFKELKGIFKGKRLVAKVDDTLGAGIKIEHMDTVIDFTFKKYINDTIENLR